MSSKMSTALRFVRCPRCRKVLPEPPDVTVYECGGCGTILQAKKRKNDTVDAAPRKLEEDSSGKRKMEQVSGDQEPSSSTNHSIDRKPSDHNDLHTWSQLPCDEDQDAAKKEENCTVDSASTGVKEYSSGKQKMVEQPSDDQEACSSSNQQLIVTSTNEPDRNDPRSSTELSGHGDPESSPEATAHNRKGQVIKQDHEQHKTNNRSRSRSPEAAVHDRIDQDRKPVDEVLENFEIEGEFEESSRELVSEVNEMEESSQEEAVVNTKTVRASSMGSKSSFKSLIAEKLLDTRQKKAVYMDEDDMLSEDGSADLRHRRRFDRISSEETLGNPQFGDTRYEYEGSVSSFDGTDNQIPTKKHVDSGNEYHHHKHRREFHPSKGRRGKDENRSTEFRSYYGNTNPSRLGVHEFRDNPRHRPPPIPGNAKMERLELLKMVRELQDQLERTNVSHSAQQLPSYYDLGLNHPGRYGQRMAFSGETVATNRRGDGDTGMCHRCYPQDRHFSAQLPRQHVCCNGPHYVPSTCYSSESDFTPVNVVKPEPYNHRHRIDVPKPYDSPKKRYVRPIAGGSPWITCYRCSELIQLPQSFLVLKKRCHSLRCGACQKVLNYTVSDGTHVHRYYPEETIAAPPSSEVEDYGNSRVDPVSCSDISFQKSYSTETDRNGSREFGEERREAVMSRGPSGSTGPSSSKASGRRKVISEIEEVEPGHNGSPLHWLMGYASPSKVIRG